MRKSVCLTALIPEAQFQEQGSRGPKPCVAACQEQSETHCLPTEVVGHDRSNKQCAKSSPSNALTVRTATTRPPRTRRPPLAGSRCRSFAIRAASTRRTKRRSSLRGSEASHKLASYRGVSSTVKLSVSKTELLGSNPSSPASLIFILKRSTEEV